MSSVLSSPAIQSFVIVPELERETLRVIGKDAVSWLNGLVTCDVAAVVGRRGAAGLLLSKQGKVLADLDAVAGQGELLLGVGAGLGEAVREMLEHYLVMEDVELELAPEMRWLRLHGARAEQALSDQRPGGAIDWLGVGGAALVVPATDVEQTVSSLLAAFPGSVRAAAAEWELLRVRHGFPTFGTDYGPEDNPHEAALDRRAVSWTKGCYLGQEVVCMQDMRGRLKRRLVVLEIEGASPVSPGSDVLASGHADAIGRLTSVASDGENTFAIARLRAPFFEGAAALSVSGRATRIVAPATRG